MRSQEYGNGERRLAQPATATIASSANGRQVLTRGRNMLRKFSLTLVLLLAYGRVAGQETMTIEPAPNSRGAGNSQKATTKVQKAKESPKLIAYGGWAQIKLWRSIPRTNLW